MSKLVIQTTDFDIENNPPTSTRSTSSQLSNSKLQQQASSTTSAGTGGGGTKQPLSPRPININTNITSPPTYQSTSTTNNIERYKDQIFQLNLEIQGLKQRLKVTSSASKNELLDLLAEKDVVIENKGKQINALNDKFNKITKAVNGMEREMNALKKAKKESDDEVKKANRHLGVREKEVNVLVTRCAQQEAKLNEMKGVRVLEKELSALKKMRDKEKETQDKEVQGLMGDLQTLGNEKKSLIDEILSLKTLNKNLEDELSESKSEVQQKRDKISTLYDELKDLHESKEKESTECIAMRKNIQDLKNEVLDRQTEADELKVTHRKEISALRKELLEQHDLAISAKDTEIQTLKNNLETKEKKLVETSNELTQLKQDHQSAQNELASLKKEHDTLSSLTKDEAEANETERNSLRNQLDKMTNEVKELNALNRELKCDNESFSTQVTDLKEKHGNLEEQIRNLTEKEDALVRLQKNKADTILKLEEELRFLKEVSLILRLSYFQFLVLFVY